MNTPITRVGDSGIIPIPKLDSAKEVGSGKSFDTVLKGFVEDVSSLQNKADESIVKLNAGEINDVHEVMIAVEKADIAMEFMLEIRNKIVEAYQEVMRMPV